jgi:hypothetical protein
MKHNDYMPSSEQGLCDMGDVVIPYATENCVRWGVRPPGKAMIDKFEDFKLKMAKCKDPTHSQIDTLAKNNARKLAEKEMRDYLQGLVVRNTSVTDEDRRTMGLRLRDTTPTTIGAPSGTPTAEVSYPGYAKLKISTSHAKGEPFDDKGNYGRKFIYTVREQTAPTPTDAELNMSVFTRRKSLVFTFAPEESGKKMYFRLAYENSKGKAGSLSPLFSATIP